MVIKIFWKMLKVRLIDKAQGYGPTKRKYHWFRTLKILYADGLNFESNY